MSRNVQSKTSARSRSERSMAHFSINLLPPARSAGGGAGQEHGPTLCKQKWWGCDPRARRESLQCAPLSPFRPACAATTLRPPALRGKQPPSVSQTHLELAGSNQPSFRSTIPTDHVLIRTCLILNQRPEFREFSLLFRPSTIKTLARLGIVGCHHREESTPSGGTGRYSAQRLRISMYSWAETTEE